MRRTIYWRNKKNVMKISRNLRSSNTNRNFRISYVWLRINLPCNVPASARQDIETYILNRAVRVIRKQWRIIANRKEQKRKMKNYKERINIERTKTHKTNIEELGGGDVNGTEYGKSWCEEKVSFCFDRVKAGHFRSRVPSPS